MKKLMIAAAAAAMIGGASADDIKINYNQIGTNEALNITQVLQYKTKASTWKNINLDADKKSFGKAVKHQTLAVDGVYYYDAKTGKWGNFEWNKATFDVAENAAAPSFDIFENADGNKALAVMTGTWFTTFDAAVPAYGESAEATTYGTLKYVTVKVEVGETKVSTKVSTKVLDRTVTNLKDTTGNVKYTIKAFADKGRLGTKNYKTAQEQIDDYVAKLREKAEKTYKPLVK